jgi:hypothetical protein
MDRRDEVDAAFTWHKTDKVSHGYGMIYDKIPRSIKNLFEIGIGGGNSIAAWLDIFPDAHIYALDVNDKEFDHPRVTVIKSDIKQYSPNGLPKFDLVVDDGSHNVEDIIAGWKLLQPFCDGVYVIEDVSIDYFQEIINVVRGTSDVNTFVQTSHGGGSRALVSSFSKVIQW